METQWWRIPETSPAVVGTEQASDDTNESTAPFVFLLAFTGILLLAPQQMFPVLAPLRIAMLAALGGILTHAVSRLSRGQSLIVLSPGIVAILGLVGWAVATIPFSFWPGGSVGFLLESYSKTLLVFLLLVSVVSSLSRLRVVIMTLVVLSVPLALTTVRNLMSGVYVSGGDRPVGYQAPLTENPNDMALMLNLILPLVIGSLLAARQWWSRFALALIIGLLVVGVISTFSRAGFLTLGVIFLVYFWRLRNRPERIMIPIAFVFMVFAMPFVPVNYVDRIATITDVQSDPTGSSQARSRDTRVALQLVADNPIFGSGIGMNAFVMDDARGATWTEIHNVYLALAVDLGLPGLLLFLLVLLACFRSVGAALSPATLGRHRTLYLSAESIKVSLIAFSVAAFFHPVAYHFYFYYIAGLALCVAPIMSSTRASEAGVKS